MKGLHKASNSMRSKGSKGKSTVVKEAMEN